MYQVIIADDEVIERTVLGRKLEKAFGDGICLRQARNGREVLALYHEKPADILILDIEMPGVTGLEAAEQIRAEGAGCGIIFLTAFDEFAYAKRAISVRALDYLLKPCDDRELIAAVEEGMRLADGRRRRAAQMEGAGRSGRETVPAGRQARNVSAGQAQDPAARDPARFSGGAPVPGWTDPARFSGGAPVPGWTDPARPGSGAEIGGDGMRAAEPEGAAGTGGQQVAHGRGRWGEVQIGQKRNGAAVEFFRERRADVVGSQSRLHVRNRNSAIESRQSARKCACGIPLHDHEIGAQTFQCGVQCSEQMSHHRRSSRLRGRRR